MTKHNFILFLFIRCFIALFLAYKVFYETGFWTAFNFFLIFIGFETVGTAYIRMAAAIKELYEADTR